jgi:hypothetical protein
MVQESEGIKRAWRKGLQRRVEKPSTKVSLPHDRYVFDPDRRSRCAHAGTELSLPQHPTPKGL